MQVRLQQELEEAKAKAQRDLDEKWKGYEKQAEALRAQMETERQLDVGIRKQLELEKSTFVAKKDELEKYARRLASCAAVLVR